MPDEKTLEVISQLSNNVADISSKLFSINQTLAAIQKVLVDVGIKHAEK